MKKSILKQMAAAGARGGEGPDVGVVSNPLAGRRQSPVISNVSRALTNLSEDSVVTLDPNKIERSPFSDRFVNDGEANDELETLKISIAAEGQKIPVLVRAHPTKSGHYQLAYGYRRLAAIKALNSENEDLNAVKVKAYIRELSDRQLIEEQSIENGVREGLTWIEQAMWSLQLKNVGMTQRAICPILGLSEAAISHFGRVTSVIPEDIIYKIGRAKSVGRPKWTALAELMQNNSKIDRIRQLAETPEFLTADSPTRFSIVFEAVKVNGTERVQPAVKDVWSPNGKSVSVISRASSKMMSLEFADVNGKHFGRWINTNLDELYGLYEAYTKSEKEQSGD